VFDLSYAAYHESLKKEYQRTGDPNHSLPMLPKDLEKMFAYADREFELGKITKTQYLFWKAFASISFTLWTRYVFFFTLFYFHFHSSVRLQV
jgi:hypothetical protein